MEREPWERFDRPIVADDMREMLDELLTAGVRPLHLTFCVPPIHLFHSSLFPRSCIIHLSDLQDQTKILADHYTTLRSSIAIMSTNKGR